MLVRLGVDLFCLFFFLIIILLVLIGWDILYVCVNVVKKSFWMSENCV